MRQVRACYIRQMRYIALAVFVVAASFAAGAKTTVWNANTSGVWSNPANWSSGVPATSDTVLFTNPSSPSDISTLDINISPASITMAGFGGNVVLGVPLSVLSLTITSGTFNLSGNSLTVDTLVIGGGTLDATSGAVLVGAGGIWVQPSGTYLSNGTHLGLVAGMNLRDDKGTDFGQLDIMTPGTVILTGSAASTMLQLSFTSSGTLALNGRTLTLAATPFVNNGTINNSNPSGVLRTPGIIVSSPGNYVPGGSPRHGIFGLDTTRGDRLFITLLGSAFIFLAWLGIFGVPLWGGLVLALLWGFMVFKWV